MPTLDKNARPCLENNLKQKRAGGVVEVVECQPSKCEALSSNPKLNKNKNNKIKYALVDFWYKYVLSRSQQTSSICVWKELDTNVLWIAAGQVSEKLFISFIFLSSFL
jgi:hypothetical protein